MTWDRKCPLSWMDGAILISFSTFAKYCVELARSSSLVGNEFVSVTRRDVFSTSPMSKMLLTSTVKDEHDSLEQNFRGGMLPSLSLYRGYFLPKRWSFNTKSLYSSYNKAVLHAEKLVNLEIWRRWNNLRIYGVPEGRESGSDTDFVSDLLLSQLKLADGAELQIHPAPKPPSSVAPRSITVNFL